MRWSAGFILSGLPAPSVCHHTEQTSLNLLFIAGASQRSPRWHINNSLQRDASLFCALQRPTKSIPTDSPSPSSSHPPSQPINDNHCFPFVHYDPGSSIKRDSNMHFLCAGGDVGFPEGGSSLSPRYPPKSLGGGAHIISDKRDDLRCHYLFSHNLRSTLTAGQSQSRGPIKAGGKRSCVTVTQRESLCPSLFWLVCTTGTECLLCSTLFFPT